ncbi:disease resistance protein RPV1-like [Alnus glutinosa]|uniref:disease resistance protein RPV1-like n=1 Tax=Alnus glutinosa TaxID=3517 RepID=UPI002D77B061|nr:disease resistance protein RPV1-like [Alnus glutinosa]
MNFIDHLHSALVQAGIRTFLDDKEIPKGETISIELLNAIQRSKISVVVFSKRYASSSWCLDELAKIIECKQTIGHTLIPIFYHMNPSDVRQQTGTFAEAFSKHEERFQTNLERVQRWRDALNTAANCSGFHLESIENGYYVIDSKGKKTWIPKGPTKTAIRQSTPKAAPPVKSFDRLIVVEDGTEEDFKPSPPPTFLDVFEGALSSREKGQCSFEIGFSPTKEP